MEGWVLSFVADNSEDKRITYWSGSGFTEDLTKSQFFLNIIEARQQAANLQGQYIDRTVTIIPAKNGIHF